MKKHDRLALLRQLDGAYTLPMQTFIDRAPGLDDGLDVLLPEGIEPSVDTPVLLIPGDEMVSTAPHSLVAGLVPAVVELETERWSEFLPLWCCVDVIDQCPPDMAVSDIVTELVEYWRSEE
jgi:hypothetical protein